ncbi:cytochrome b5-like heme/steroid binding domain-containing protein [Mycotypha africana]|uniref:cytochrome b5-like heme/steroid binding domain-containing protein n=1 Tax=Mycotypha africana TaxID=64632 RepID=UPI002300524C|nr:cytochrome b5-like heme/steroid binding domain-containing protein [Mycotypha africana]KAI8979662.1 cytochrome b5-like heme/steroid binding domain-containing protein [Mycotypha africana]
MLDITPNILYNQLKGMILLYLSRYLFAPNKLPYVPAKHPEVLIFKNYTPLELVPFNGENGARILMGVNGSVYDVTQGRNFYGPGGPYENFAGHDASRGLAKNSFDEEMMADPHGPIDKLEDLTADEWESLREWEKLFAGKYLLVGKLVENKSS